MAVLKKYNSISKHLKDMINRQKKYIDTWSAVLSVLEEKSPEEAVAEAKRIISEKLDKVQTILNENIVELEKLEEANA